MDWKGSKMDLRSKDKIPPSIFNDVIGPIMRGPSSSHCAAAVRIGRIARDLMGGDLREVLIAFDPNGSLVTTHESQGSDMGIFAGLLGWDPTDERMLHASQVIHQAGIQVKIEIQEYDAPHPNTYKMCLRSAQEVHEIMAISTGGGMVEVTQLDGIQFSLAGDYYETLIFCDAKGREILEFLQSQVEADHIHLWESDFACFVEVKAQRFLSLQGIACLVEQFPGIRVRTIAPVLPVLSRREISVPFRTISQLLDYNKGKNLDLGQLALHYESARGSLAHEQVMEKMREIVLIMQASIQQGIQGTEYAGRILGYQSGGFKTRMEAGELLDGGLLNRIILYTTALMETKSAMGVIVAAPTAGACGGLPGACLGAATAMGLSVDEMARAMLAAGLIGVFIASQATFAAEVGGCQAECGAGSGMAAAALVTLARGSLRQALNAASIALQNILGMICDPVANRVEVPCLGKNVLAASNALACANLALAGFDPVIPLDETIDTMDAVGKSLPAALRCTALGGLSITPTSKAIEKRLAGISPP
jgi:L-serine dehydratase